MAESAYDVLGVGRGATPEVIRAAHRALAKTLHPDRPGGDADRFAAVNAAADVLLDPDARAALDAELDAAAAQPAAAPPAPDANAAAHAAWGEPVADATWGEPVADADAAAHASWGEPVNDAAWGTPGTGPLPGVTSWLRGAAAAAPGLSGLAWEAAADLTDVGLAALIARRERSAAEAGGAPVARGASWARRLRSVGVAVLTAVAWLMTVAACAWPAAMLPAGLAVVAWPLRRRGGWWLPALLAVGAAALAVGAQGGWLGAVAAVTAAVAPAAANRIEGRRAVVAHA